MKSLFIVLFALAITPVYGNETQKPIRFTPESPIIDGQIDSEIWANIEWHSMNHVWIGEDPTPQDFSGAFKLIWDTQKLYLLARITDDRLVDQHPNPLTQYWDDDCLEIFIDPNQSGGNHLNNHNAFAYHIALDNQVVDMGLDGQPRLFDHVTSRWQRNQQNEIIWEAAITLYPETYNEHQSETHKPLALSPQMKIGFMLAYCDNDKGNGREHFVGSNDITPVNGTKNRGYIDASTFERWQLIK